MKKKQGDDDAGRGQNRSQEMTTMSRGTMIKSRGDNDEARVTMTKLGTMIKNRRMEQRAGGR